MGDSSGPEPEAGKAVVRIFTCDPDNPGELAASAIARTEAAARRFSGAVEIEVLALDSDLAAELGAAVDPTVAIGDLVIAVGQAPPAGHLLRAIEAFAESNP